MQPAVGQSKTARPRPVQLLNTFIHAVLHFSRQCVASWHDRDGTARSGTQTTRTAYTLGSNSDVGQLAD